MRAYKNNTYTKTFSLSMYSDFVSLILSFYFFLAVLAPFLGVFPLGLVTLRAGFALDLTALAGFLTGAFLAFTGDAFFATFFTFFAAAFLGFSGVLATFLGFAAFLGLEGFAAFFGLAGAGAGALVDFLESSGLAHLKDPEAPMPLVWRRLPSATILFRANLICISAFSPTL